MQELMCLLEHKRLLLRASVKGNLTERRQNEKVRKRKKRRRETPAVNPLHPVSQSEITAGVS